MFGHFGGSAQVNMLREYGATLAALMELVVRKEIATEAELESLIDAAREKILAVENKTEV